MRRVICAVGFKKETHDLLFVVEDDGVTIVNGVKGAPWP
jgi:hypothetical protein